MEFVNGNKTIEESDNFKVVCDNVIIKLQGLCKSQTSVMEKIL